jgi:hypothetical protein
MLAQEARNSARFVALYAAQEALRASPVSDAPVPQVLAALEANDIRTAVRALPKLESLRGRLDESYWDLSDAQGGSNAPGVFEAFAKARAVNALVCALGRNVVQSAIDAIYEAYASLEDDKADEFLESAKAMLRRYQVTR